MKNSEELLKLLATFVEKGILTTQDAKKEIFTILKFCKTKTESTSILF